MMYAADFRAKAREALKGNWPIALAVGFVAGLLGAGTVFGRINFNVWFNAIDEAVTLPITLEVYFLELEEAISTFSEYFDSESARLFYFGSIGVSVLASLLMGILQIIIGGAVTLGYVKFHLNLIDNNNEARFHNLFSQFHKLGTGIAMQLLRGIYVFLWSFIPIVGYVKIFSYALTPYILYENPNMSANEAITESRKLMDGNKWRLFCLDLSFLGWGILSVLFTCGWGIFILRPYQEASFAAFYREIKREKYGDPVAEEPIVEGTSYEEMVNDRYREPEYRDVTFYEVPEEKNGSTDEN